MKMNSRQLEKYRAALERLLSEVLLSTQSGKGGRHHCIWGLASAHSSVSILGASLSEQG